jgi:hypothetical protein
MLKFFATLVVDTGIIKSFDYAFYYTCENLAFSLII